MSVISLLMLIALRRFVTLMIIPCLVGHLVSADEFRDKFKTEALSFRLKSTRSAEWFESPALSHQINVFEEAAALSPTTISAGLSPVGPTDRTAIEQLAALGPNLESALASLSGEISRLSDDLGRGSPLELISIQAEFRTAQQRLKTWQNDLSEHLPFTTLPAPYSAETEVHQLGLLARNWIQKTEALTERLRPIFETHQSIINAEEDRLRRLHVLRGLHLLVARGPVLAIQADLQFWLVSRLTIIPVCPVPVVIQCERPILVGTLHEDLLYQTLLPLIRQMVDRGARSVLVKTSWDDQTKEFVIRLEHPLYVKQLETFRNERLGDLAFAHMVRALHQIHGTFHQENTGKSAAFLIRWPAARVMTMGERVGALRKDRGWDQRTLAAQSGVSPSVLSSLERDLQDDYVISAYIRLAHSLGVSLGLLLDATVELPDVTRTDPPMPLTRMEVEDRLRILGDHLERLARGRRISVKEWAAKLGEVRQFVHGLLLRLMKGRDVKTSRVLRLIRALNATVFTGLAPEALDHLPQQANPVIAYSDEEMSVVRALQGSHDPESAHLRMAIEKMKSFDPRIDEMLRRTLGLEPDQSDRSSKATSLRMGVDAGRLRAFAFAVLRRPEILAQLECAGHLGSRIQERLSTLNISSAEAADEANIPRSQFHAVMSGTTQDPGLDVLQRMARVLKTSVRWLVLDQGSPDTLGAQEVGPFKERAERAFAAAPDRADLRALFWYTGTRLEDYLQGSPPRMKRTLFLAWASYTEFGFLAANEPPKPVPHPGPANRLPRPRATQRLVERAG